MQWKKRSSSCFRLNLGGETVPSHRIRLLLRQKLDSFNFFFEYITALRKFPFPVSNCGSRSFQTRKILSTEEVVMEAVMLFSSTNLPVHSLNMSHYFLVYWAYVHFARMKWFVFHLVILEAERKPTITMRDMVTIECCFPSNSFDPPLALTFYHLLSLSRQLLLRCGPAINPSLLFARIVLAFAN